jgi:predicted ATPase
MRQVVILTGAHGTGKTAIAETMAGKTGLPFYGSQAAAAHAEFGVLPSEDLDLVTRLKVQNSILRRWVGQWGEAQQTGGIFDRCPLDFAAYTLADVQRVLDGRLSMLVQDYTKCCLTLAKTLPPVFLCEPHGDVIGDRGADRPDAGNLAYATLIQTLIVGLIAEGGIDHEVVGPGTVSQRVDFVGRSLSAAFDANAERCGRPTICPTPRLS